MKKYSEIKLPCKPYIKKYASAIYGAPLKADRSNALSLVVSLALEKRTYESRHFGDSFLYKHYTDFLPVLVNRWQFQALGFDFSTENVIDINKFLEDDFELDLYKFCRDYTRHFPEASGRNNGYKEAIHKFSELHFIELEYDVTFYGLQRKELRFRQKMEARLKKRKAG